MADTIKPATRLLDLYPAASARLTRLAMNEKTPRAIQEDLICVLAVAAMTDTKAFDAERARVAKLEAENAKMREQLKTERRAGIEEAAQMARAHGAAQVHATFGPEATLQDALMIGYRLCGDAIERDIRALADKPAQKGDDNG